MNRHAVTEIKGQSQFTGELLPSQSVLRNLNPILVVEDTLVLQRIIKMQFEKIGVAYQIVSDGMAAVKASMDNEYSMVLMDCHMPELDGYQATKMIREKEKNMERHLPIIALTADITPGTKEKCLQAGMDDYLTKPINGKELIQVLHKWLPKGESRQIMVNHAVLDMKIIMELQKMLNHDKPMLKELIGDYIQKSWLDISKLHEAVQVRDYSAIKKIVYQMCSASTYLGAEQLSKIFGIIEKWADQQDEEQILLSLAMVDEEMNKVVAELQKIMD